MAYIVNPVHFAHGTVNLGQYQQILSGCQIVSLSIHPGQTLFSGTLRNDSLPSATNVDQVKVYLKISRFHHFNSSPKWLPYTCRKGRSSGTLLGGVRGHATKKFFNSPNLLPFCPQQYINICF